ncbi:MAG: DUF2384 domain-containing protein [Cytophagales bacterium]|nr:MAG: DUF2384 domain-containing protein [Cytophagales bacterium]
MDTGTVKFFNESKGFGFIKVNGTAQDVFVNVHFSDLQEHIQQNDEVSFDIQEGKRGLNAVNVKLGTSFSEKKSLKSNDELTAFYKHGIRVFEDSLKFERWLNKPNGALDGQLPADLIQTAEGIKQVDKILGRIEHGIFS